ncbi:hypothetical protein AAC691_11410 [Nguyenibacter vanlangensis]|uniref:DDE Tnp4 domain-containing protein n=1 Tax=Nguyenibacter vanlangensis TaxID=1216886 RepID=A0ABZ3CZL3_9PROT
MVRLGERRLRIVDGSVIRSNGKDGTDWRLHAAYDPAGGPFSQLEISDNHGGQSLSRHSFEKGDLILADRGYARAGDMPGRLDCCMCRNWGRTSSPGWVGRRSGYSRRTARLARSWLAAHLILGLLIDEAVAGSLAFSPSVAGATGRAPVAVAPAKIPPRHTPCRNP